MTNAEWIKAYPDDWHKAEDAAEFSPDQYDFVWNEDYTFFRLNPLAWNSQESYVSHQGDEQPEEYDYPWDSLIRSDHNANGQKTLNSGEVEKTLDLIPF